MFENISHHKIKSGTDRNFGLVFATIFLIICLFPLWFGKNIHFWALILSFIFFFCAILIPRVLSLPNKFWFKFGILLGTIISPIIMGIIFFLTVTPTGLIMRILGKDILNQRIDKSVKTYWLERKEGATSMKKQF